MRSPRLRPPAAVALAAALALSGCGGPSRRIPQLTSTVRPGIAPTPPAQGAYFGAQVSARPGLAMFEKDLGRRLDLVPVYRGWAQSFDGVLPAGDRYPLLTWGGTDTVQIAQGRQDVLIRQRARTIKATGRPVFLRWLPEMDSTALRGQVHSPAAYIAAWDHIREIFREVGAENVAWVWCAGAGGGAAYYPGDGQVDWIGVDEPAKTGYTDLRDLITPFTTWAKNHPKPIMVGEFGVPASYGARRVEWLRNAAKTLQNPQIKAVVYSDDGRSSVDGDPAALSALRELATAPYFNPRGLPVSSG
jgi:hypothetical protein